MAPLNPQYGSGIFRRRVRLVHHPGRIEAEVEDNNHGFRVALDHDGTSITALQAQPLRHPFNTCSEAVRPLSAGVGHRLADGSTALRARLDPGANCTHLLDLVILGAAHAAAGEQSGSVLYDIAVEDERDGLTVASIECDGKRLHEWRIVGHKISEPHSLAGRPVLRGFYGWAAEAFPQRQLEAAMVLQRAYFVAQSRRYSFSPPQAHPAVNDGMPQGSCYSYNRGVVERAFRSHGTIRDFTHAPELLLKFLP